MDSYTCFCSFSDLVFHVTPCVLIRMTKVSTKCCVDNLDTRHSIYSYKTTTIGHNNIQACRRFTTSFISLYLIIEPCLEYMLWPVLLDNFNPLNAELNPICYLLALLGAHHFLHVSSIRVKSLTFRLLMSYIYGAPILDVSRSHTTTQHSR